LDEMAVRVVENVETEGVIRDEESEDGKSVGDEGSFGDEDSEVESDDALEEFSEAWIDQEIAEGRGGEDTEFPPEVTYRAEGQRSKKPPAAQVWTDYGVPGKLVDSDDETCEEQYSDYEEYCAYQNEVDDGDCGSRLIKSTVAEARRYLEKKPDTDAARADPHRFLADKFPTLLQDSTTAPTDVVVVYMWTGEYKKLGYAMLARHLYHAVVPSPIDVWGKRLQPEQVFIGRNKEVTLSQAKETRDRMMRDGDYHFDMDYMPGDDKRFQVYALDFRPQEIIIEEEPDSRRSGSRRRAVTARQSPRPAPPTVERHHLSNQDLGRHWLLDHNMSSPRANRSRS
jgi:hypothetical protein